MTATPAAPAVRRTTDVLADGREIIYFDDSEPYVSGAASRATPDTRPLDHGTGGGSQVRFDVLTGEWVAIASHRNTRTFLPPADECPLCPTGRGRVPSEIPASDYDVVVFENRFPSFSMSVEGEPGLVDSEPLFPVRPGRGAARWSPSPPTTTRRSPRSTRTAPGRSSRRGPIAPATCRRCPASRRCSRSRTAAGRSGSP